MKVRRYDELLRARGYKIVEHNKYQGCDVYIKQHTDNEIMCFVEKDSHGKAQDMNFKFTWSKPQDSFESLCDIKAL